jgi:hypothetical protein
MTGKPEAPGPGVRDELREYAAVRDEIIGLLESARKAAARTGRIVEAEQRAGDAPTTASGSSNDSRRTF